MTGKLRKVMEMALRTGARLLAGAMLCVAGLRSQPQPVLLEITVQNQVWYFDTGELSKFATVSDMVMVPRFPPFQPCAGMADIISVNGTPVNGALLMYGAQLSPSPNPTPGRNSVSDIQRAALWSVYLEILAVDGRQVGSLMASGMHGGSAPPGSPKVPAVANWAITGGTGAFLGAAGQMIVSGNVANQTVRFVSMESDPSTRRSSGMGALKYIVQLIPAARPEVVRNAAGPAVFHADFTTVTANAPVTPGEILIARAVGLGPVREPLEPGQAFPEDPLAIVNSPVEVTLAGISTEVISQVGWPGTLDQYRVDFRVPRGLGAGTVPLRLSAAWIPGSELQLMVR